MNLNSLDFSVNFKYTVNVNVKSKFKVLCSAFVLGYYLMNFVTSSSLFSEDLDIPLFTYVQGIVTKNRLMTGVSKITQNTYNLSQN